MNEIRRERNKELFIQIACDLIRKEGVEAATIRNIASRAGYNSATLYTYFDNQAHILFCAYMKFEEELLGLMQELVTQTQKSYIEIWPMLYTTLARYYLANPNIFECAFVTVYDKDGGKERQELRDKESMLNKFLLVGLKRISDENNIPLSKVFRIHGICFSLTIGTILLVLKQRVGENSEETIIQLCEDITEIQADMCAIK